MSQLSYKVKLLVGFLTLGLIIGLIYLAFIIGGRPSEPVKTNIGAPSLQEQLETTDEGLNPSSRQKFIKLLPINNQRLNIDYEESSDSFIVQVIEEPIDQAKKEANQIFQENNLDPNKERIEYLFVAGLDGRSGP